MQKLNIKPDKNPFKVPENYFEDVNRKILSATTDIGHGAIKPKPYRRLKTYLAIAAGIAAFLLVGYFTTILVINKKTDKNVSAIVAGDTNETYVNEIDLPALEESAATLDNFNENTDVNKNDIIDYLLLENIQISEIYEQL